MSQTVALPATARPLRRRVRRLFTLVAAALAAFVALAALLYSPVYRPWSLSWGATDEEVAAAMVGDERIPDPSFLATRAITIDAPAERIWPLLVQIGYHRAGFYSYDSLDNGGEPSAEGILPQYQNIKVGDSIPMSATSNATVVHLEPNKRLGLTFHSKGDVLWQWKISQLADGRSRLVTRFRWDTSNARFLFMLEAFEIYMIRKCLLGIKERAEA